MFFFIMILPPQRSTLFPYTTLFRSYARVVTIKKFTEPEPFIEAVKRKLDSFGIKGRVELPRDENRSRRQDRSEEHTSELQSRQYLVCRLLLEKKKQPADNQYLQSNS